MELITVEAKQVIEQTETLAKSYDNFAIVSTEAYQYAAEDRKALNSKIKELDAMRKSLTQPLDDSKKKIMAMFKAPLDRLTVAKKAVDTGMLKWQRQLEEAARIERERLAEIQRKTAEALRQKAAKEAARIAGLKTEAAKSRAAEAAADLAEQAAMVESAPVVVEQAPAVAQGISTRKNWKFEVMDKTQLPAEYLIADEKMIGKMVRATQGKITISGVRVYSEDIIASR